ncbi:PorV/PorQ family protein [candidate division KSB1 bacterium]|nr:PorV/PorQ family protein [candidate division KSB1 bacterium]
MIKIIRILLLVILIPFSLANGQWDYGFDFNKAGSAGLQFLKIGIGARETAMGEAALATTRGVNSIFWNPAGIAYTDGYAFSSSYTTWLLNSTLPAAAVAIPVKSYAVIAASVIYFGIPEFEETTVLQQDGTGRLVTAGDLAVSLAVARQFTDKLALGMQMRYVREQLDQDNFSNVLVDLGGIYFTGYRHIRLAVAAQHFGPDIKMLRDTFRMPLIFKIGLADDLFHTDWHYLTFACDLVHPTDNVEGLNLGLEYGLSNHLFLRSGYRINSDLGNWALGLGLNQRLFGWQGTLNYAYTDYGNILGRVDRFTLELSF